MQRIESNIFRTITDAEWSTMSQSGCLRLKTYDKNTIILHMGDTTTEIGIVASGNVNIENIDILGNKTILSNVAARHVFAETYAFCNEPLMVDAVAGEDSQILFLNLEMMRQSYNNSSWYAKIMQNMLAISMQKKHDTLQSHLLHITKDNSRTSVGLFIRTVKKICQQNFSDTV